MSILPFVKVRLQIFGRKFSVAKIRSQNFGRKISVAKSSVAKFRSQKVRSKLGCMLSGQSVDTLSFDGRKVREEPGRRRRRDRTSGTPAAVCSMYTVFMHVAQLIETFV